MKRLKQYWLNRTNSTRNISKVQKNDQKSDVYKIEVSERKYEKKV